jgi:hypothetical protein
MLYHAGIGFCFRARGSAPNAPCQREMAFEYNAQNGIGVRCALWPNLVRCCANADLRRS